MRIFIVAIALVVLGCGTIDPTVLKEKQVGYWGEQSSSGKSLKWTCTNSQTFQDTCKQQDTKNSTANWFDAIWDLLKRI
jgi:hypothetical protein